LPEEDASSRRKYIAGRTEERQCKATANGLVSDSRSINQDWCTFV
jgi:hypothetical protein